MPLYHSRFLVLHAVDPLGCRGAALLKYHLHSDFMPLLQEVTQRPAGTLE